MIHRDVEEPLHLLGVQIHGQNTAHSRSVQKIGHQLGRDGHARLIFPVLPGIAEERNDRRNPVGTGPAAGIHHDEQLHEVLIGRGRSRLDQEDIATPDVFLDLHVGLAVGKRTDGRLPQRSTDVMADFLRQIAVGRTAENFHLWLKREHGAGR